MAGSITFILKEPWVKQSIQNPKKEQTQSKDRKKGRKNNPYETLVYMVFVYRGTRIRISTGEKIKNELWNPEKQRAKESQENPFYKNFNTRLDNIEIAVKNAVLNHLNTNTRLVPSLIKSELSEVVQPSPEKQPEQRGITFFDAIQQYIDTCDKKAGTKMSYKMTKKVLSEYQDYSKKAISFNDINLEFYFDFVNFLTIKQKYSKNTIGDHIKKVKVFMNYFFEKGLTSSLAHRSKLFSKPQEETDSIYLNENELLEIYKYDFTDNVKLDRVRDIFIIGCYTGLRFSDLGQLTPDKFIKNGTQLKIKTIKTGETVIIPLHWTIKEILKKYNGGLPRRPSNQKMNTYLKDIGREAKFNDIISIGKTKAGLNVATNFKKWELITVHTARRSFATNMFLAGVPAISIMKLTGHNTERAFMKYIKVSQEQNADKLSMHPFFNKASLRVVNK
jgi:integrase